MPSTFEAAVLADHVYDRELAPPIRGSRWTTISVPGDEQSGIPDTDVDGFFEFQSFGAAVYRKGESNEFVIAFHGLDGIDDLFNDVLPINAGSLSPQFFVALDFVERAKAEISSIAGASAQISFVGHSLGGALAAIFAIRENTTATVFSPVPFIGAAEEAVLELVRPDTQEVIPAVANPGILSNITNVTIEGEIASRHLHISTGGSGTLAGQVALDLLGLNINNDMAGRFGTPDFNFAVDAGQTQTSAINLYLDR